MLWTEVPGQPGPLATCPESAAPALGGAQRAAAGVGTCGGHGARRVPPPPPAQGVGPSGRAAASDVGMKL